MTWRLPKIIQGTYEFDLNITGHERMVPTYAHFETYKEAMLRYADGPDYLIYKEALEASFEICALIDKNYFQPDLSYLDIEIFAPKQRS